MARPIGASGAALWGEMTVGVFVLGAARLIGKASRQDGGRIRAPGQCLSGRAGPGQVVVAAAARWAARALSRSTAAVAATRAVPSAIRVICQPAVPPAVTTRTVVAGTGAVGMVPPSPTGIGLAKAAVAATADASRPQVTAVRTAASRASRVPVFRAAGCRWGPGREWCVNMIVSSRGNRPRCSGGRLVPPWSAAGVITTHAAHMRPT
jgi:hypothetical protein